MLNSLRRASESFVGRAIMSVVLIVIVISFAIWGIGDIFSGFGSNVLAKVGGRTITTDAYRTAYQQQLNQLQQQQQRQITAQEARAQGLDAQVLSGLIADASLDVQAQRFGLAVGDKQVADAIVADPSLKGPDGKFDATVFANLLQQNGLTEAKFVEQQRALMSRRMLADAMLANFPVPQPMREAVDQFRNETRSVDLFVLPAAAVGPIADPSDKDLQAWFDQRKQIWRAPEYRSLVVLSLSAAALADPAKVSDADARAFYEANKAMLGVPEKRALRQATFADRASADAASAAIAQGQDFAKAAQANKGSVVDLGTVDRDGVYDQAVAKAAFSTPLGKTSAPVQGQFGIILAQVDKIIPGTLPPFDQIAPDLKKRIATQRASTQVDQLKNKIEDQRTSGKTLTEAASAVGLQVKKIAAVDAQGNGPDGKSVGAPDQADLLKAAFASDVGMDNDLLSTRDGGAVWFEVASVDPAHERALKDVRPQVLTAWREDRLSQLLSDKAKDIVQRIDKGASLTDIAKSYSAPVKTVNDVKRVGTTDVSAAIATAAFEVPVRAAGSAAADPLTRTVFEVNDSETPPFDPNSETSKSIGADLQQQLSDDVLSEYLQALQTEIGIKVDQAALTSVISGNSQPQP